MEFLYCFYENENYRFDLQKATKECYSSCNSDWLEIENCVSHTYIMEEFVQQQVWSQSLIPSIEETPYVRLNQIQSIQAESNLLKAVCDVSIMFSLSSQANDANKSIVDLLEPKTRKM